MTTPLVPFEYAYLTGTLPLFAVWLLFFFLRRDTRKEMLMASVLIGVMSVMTASVWWTVDWWHPATITGTKIGFEDFLVGFASGGIMAVAYEIVFKKRLARTRAACLHCPSATTLLLLLALLTSWLFWGVGLTSFWASTIAMVVVSAALFSFRKDLFINGVLSGIAMVTVSLFSYAVFILFSPGWISATYHFETLSGFLAFGIPAEEFIFWFLAGLVFGP